MTTIDEKVINAFTNLMIEKILSVSKDWEKPWIEAPGQKGFPQNIDGRQYSGFNSLMLFWHSKLNNYELPVFLTFNQAKEKGIYIKKGESSFPISYWNITVKDKETGEKITLDEYLKLSAEQQNAYKVTPFLKYYNIFNVEQTNLKEVNSKLWQTLEEKFRKEPLKDNKGLFVSPVMDEIIEKQRWLVPIYPKVQNQAFYRHNLSTGEEEIIIPVKSQFKTGEAYYSTALHEMTHSTGHKSRLNRNFGVKFGDERYAREELVAELTGALTAQSIGISTHIQKENAQYLKHWLECLKKEPNFLLSTMSDVNKASAMIMNVVDNTLNQKEQILNDQENKQQMSIKLNFPESQRIKPEQEVSGAKIKLR
jgi:antirestriction protein ArdC